MTMHLKMLYFFSIFFYLTNIVYAAGNITLTNNTQYELKNITIGLTGAGYSTSGIILPGEKLKRPDVQGIKSVFIDTGFAKYEFRNLSPLHTSSEISMNFSLKDNSTLGVLSYTTPETKASIEVQGSVALQANTTSEVHLIEVLLAQSMDEIRALGATPYGIHKENLSLPVYHDNTVWLANARSALNIKNPYDKNEIREIHFLTFRTDKALHGMLGMFKDLLYRPFFSQYTTNGENARSVPLGFWLRNEDAHDAYTYFADISQKSFVADVKGHMTTLFLPTNIYDTAFNQMDSPIIEVKTSSSKTLSFSFVKNGSARMHALRNARNGHAEIVSSYSFKKVNLPPPTPSASENKSDVVFYPKDADLRLGSDIIIEPSEAPYNLGGWKNTQKVIFPVHIKEDGSYIVSINYSRNSSEGEHIKLGVAVTESPDVVIPEDYTRIHTPFQSTGMNTWANYKTIELGTLRLKKGLIFLIFFEIDAENEGYVMNLRELHITKKSPTDD